MSNKRLRKELLEGFEGLAKAGLINAATMSKYKNELSPEPSSLSSVAIKKFRIRKK